MAAYICQGIVWVRDLTNYNLDNSRSGVADANVEGRRLRGLSQSGSTSGLQNTQLFWAVKGVRVYGSECPI